MRNKQGMGWVLGVACAAAVLTSCSSEPAPPVCQDLAGVSDIGGIGGVLEGLAGPNYDFVAATLQAEGTVREACPDQQWKLDRYRELVINPVTGGG